MKVVNQWAVIYYGSFQMLWEDEAGTFYITSNGAFGQRDMTINVISKEQADVLIVDKALSLIDKDN